TLIVDAHRISSAMRAHRVLLMDSTPGGATTIVSGSHRELLRTAPLYRELVHHWDDGPELPIVTGPSTPNCQIQPAS
ncbi:MAG: hypothetical protein ACRDSG_06825, partial [Pseudonocardiaceae bacterium]